MLYQNVEYRGNDPRTRCTCWMRKELRKPLPAKLTFVLTRKSNARPGRPQFGSNSPLHGAKLQSNARAMPGGEMDGLELTGIYPTHLRASFQSHCMFRRGISTMFVSLSRSIFLWVKTPTLSNCLKAENVELVRSTLRTSGKSQVLITKTIIGQCVGHLELLIRGGLGQSGAVVEQGSKGGVKEQRNRGTVGAEKQLPCEQRLLRSS